MGSHNSPVLHSTKGLLIGDVVHEDEAHGPAVVGSGDGPVALLARCVLCTENKIYHCCEQLTALYTVRFSHMQHMNKPIAQTWFKLRHLLGLNQLEFGMLCTHVHSFIYCAHDAETIIILIASLVMHWWSAKKEQFSFGWCDWFFSLLSNNW